MPFITEELYTQYFKKDIGEKSIHTLLLPQTSEFTTKKIDFAPVLAIVGEIRKYKASKFYSIKKELSALIIESADKSLEEDFDLLKIVLSFAEVKSGKGDIEVTKDLKISIAE